MRALLVENDRDLSEVVRAVMAHNNVDLQVVDSNFPALLNPGPWEDVQVAIVDTLLGTTITGLDIMAWLDANRPDILRIAFTAVPETYPETKDLADAVVSKVVRKGDIRWPDRLLEAMGVPKVVE